ncbi:uncharacterized protein B0H18DRAFT_906142, partial [Fomitopsis serialis]|uniref:uncharacterized protein n=1 Tax=Fomitopsis serialis TaxID=139415 RepID=UPI002007BC6C
MSDDATGHRPQSLLSEFYHRFNGYVHVVETALANPTDSTVLERLGDDLNQFGQLVTEHAATFPPGELGHIQNGVGLMLYDIQWAYQHRSIAGLARFLNVGRSTVRNALLEYQIAEPQQNPFPTSDLSAEPIQVSEDDHDDLLDPILPEALAHMHGPATMGDGQYVDHISSFTGPLTLLPDAQLDDLLKQLRMHYPRAGITMLDGMLRQLGHRVPRQRIRSSLSRIDPIHRTFERIRIRRRKYKVAGPNALWHHDGQHGVSIHNVRIERLWVDVTAQVGAKWAEFFTTLEVHYGLDLNNDNHIWLLHLLFLDRINDELAFFADGWNHHRIQIRDGPNRSPIDMFVFDMLVHGVRGDQLPDEAQTMEELEVYGVDWEALREDRLLRAYHQNNTQTDGASSWIGRVGPPERLNEVEVEPPE